MYSDHNLKKIIGACILAQSQTSGIEEAKKICTNKFNSILFFTTNRYKGLLIEMEIKIIPINITIQCII